MGTKARTEFNVSFKVSARLCADILTSAIEAGVYGSQWLLAYDATSEYEPVPGEPGTDQGSERLCVSVTLGRDSADGQRVERKRVKLETIAQALGHALDRRTLPEADRDGAAYIAAKLIAGEMDGPRADVIVQIAVFGRVIYG